MGLLFPAGIVLEERVEGYAKSICARSFQMAKLPNNFEAFVEGEFFIASDDGDFFIQRLRDDLAVEGIGMVKRQIVEAKRVIHRVGKYAEIADRR